MKYQIKAQSFNRKTGKLMWETRTEIIDTKNNTIFSLTKTTKEVKNVFENYWNKINPFSNEIVKVQTIKKLAH